MCEFEPGNELLSTLGSVQPPIVEQRFVGTHDPALDVHFQLMSMADIDLSYPGRKTRDHHIHATIASIEPGDRVYLQADRQRFYILDQSGCFIGKTAESFSLDLHQPELEVASIVTRYVSDSSSNYRSSIKCRQWEVIVPRLKGKRIRT